MPRTGETAFAHSSCYSMFQSSILTHWTLVLTSTKHDYVVFSSRSPRSAAVGDWESKGDTCLCDMMQTQNGGWVTLCSIGPAALVFELLPLSPCQVVGDARRRGWKVLS